MCSDYAMSFLCDILDETDKDLPKRLRNDTKEEFETLSVARWAAEELVKRIEEHPFEDIEDLFGRFALDLACFRANAEDTPSEKVFAVATEAVLQWLDDIKRYSGEYSALKKEWRYKVSTN